MKPEKVGSIVFSLDGGPVSPQYYSIEDMELTPNYENRTLSVYYKRSFPNRTNETLEQDSDAQGEVGGEFFDGFELMVDFAKEYDSAGLDNNSGSSSVAFKMSVMDKHGEVLYEIDSDWTDDSISVVKNFYLELKNLFTAEVPM